MILKEEEIDRKLFCGFIRHQVVDQCLRRENNKWVVRSDPFVDDWTEEDYQTLIGCLRNTAHTDGFVYGAFLNDVLKGFVSVERGFFGGENLYYDLSSLHVSEDMRRKGIGKELFLAAAEWARKQGQKNYISHLIPLWKVRHFIIQWAVWMPLNITRSMWKKNHMIGSWSMFCDFLEENFMPVSSGLCVMPVWGKT